MLTGTLSRLRAGARRNRALFLLISFLFLLVAAPVLAPFFDLRLLFDVFLTIIFASAIYAASEKLWHYVINTVLFLVTVSAIWIEYIFPGDISYLISQSAGLIFLLFAGIRVTSNLIKSEKITANAIFAAIVVYLIAGVLWAGVYNILQLLQPGSLNLGNIDVRDASYRLVYFSFVTLTTLGYGDIAPLTDIASAFVILEAIFGQMYITVLIAWLVGRYISEGERDFSRDLSCLKKEDGDHG
jgi:hypothetical protein